MVDEDRATDHAEGEPSDSRYFGPFGEPPPPPVDADSTYEPIPSFEPHNSNWPSPTGEPRFVADSGADKSSATTMLPPGRQGRRGPVVASLVAMAALTALVIGGAAGYGGARLAQRAADTPTTTASPAAEPGVTRTAVAPPPPSANSVEIAKRVLPATVMIPWIVGVKMLVPLLLGTRLVTDVVVPSVLHICHPPAPVRAVK